MRDVRQWWSQNPQTFATLHGETVYGDGQYELGSREFFERVDQEFFAWNRPLHDRRPFDRLFPFTAGWRVLEVGCGMGTMAMQWCQNGASLTAVDLSPTSVAMTRKRLELFGYEAQVREMDGRNLAFNDDSFDYCYSWGVLHHSPDLARSLQELVRVLKPGQPFGVMLYHRKSLKHWHRTDYLEGFLHYENRFLGELELASRYGDGSRKEGNPHTWPVTFEEVKAMLAGRAEQMECRVLGTDLDTIFQALLPGIGLFVPRWAKKVWARRWGWSLWITGVKRS